jgi:hypothetical protein
MEYKNRYGMLPPKGFDAWWKFVIDKDIKIVDDVSWWQPSTETVSMMLRRRSRRILLLANCCDTGRQLGESYR